MTRMRALRSFYDRIVGDDGLERQEKVRAGTEFTARPGIAGDYEKAGIAVPTEGNASGRVPKGVQGKGVPLSEVKNPSLPAHTAASPAGGQKGGPVPPPSVSDQVPARSSASAPVARSGKPPSKPAAKKGGKSR